MFGVEWLRQGIPVDRETSVLTREDEVIAAAKSRAREVAKRHPRREPESLTDATGKVFGFPNSHSANNILAGADARGRLKVLSAHHGLHAITKPNQMPGSPKLRRILDLWPAAVVILGVILTVAWVAALVWLIARPVWVATVVEDRAATGAQPQ